MAEIGLLKLNTTGGLVGLCDNSLLRWALCNFTGCEPCLSLMLDYWNIPLEGPLEWIDNSEDEVNNKKLSINIEELSDDLGLPDKFYQPYSSYHRESNTVNISYTQTITKTLSSFATTASSDISIDVQASVKGNTASYVTVRMSLFVNNVLMDESYIDFAVSNERKYLHTFWAGVIVANPTNVIKVEIENVTTGSMTSPSISLVDYKVKYLGVEEI